MTQQTSSSSVSRLERPRTSCLSSVTCLDRWLLPPVLLTPSGPDRADSLSPPTVPWRVLPGGQRHQAGPGEAVGPGPPALRWQGLLASRASFRASGKEPGSGSLGSLGGPAVPSCGFHSKSSGLEESLFFPDSLTASHLLLARWPWVWGHA